MSLRLLRVPYLRCTTVLFINILPVWLETLVVCFRTVKHGRLNIFALTSSNS